MFKVLLLALLLALPALGAGAQSDPSRQPTPVNGFNPDSVEVHERELSNGLDKITGRITIPDTRARVLEQPAGRTWRDYRRDYLPWFAAVAVIGTALALMVFYLFNGRVPIEGGRGTKTILRFGGFERGMHWMTASAWCVLAISGLNVAIGRIVLLPLMGASAYSVFSGWMKYAHNFLAFPFTVGIILMLLVWVRHNIPGRIDVEWFRQGGGLVGGGHPSAGKFNGGQKMVFWIVVLGGGSLAVTGFVLLFPFTVTGVTGMQVAQVAHGLVSLAMIAAMLGHIYIGSVGMEGAFDAMGNGEVDLNWARAHHDLWVAEVTARHGATGPHPADPHPAE